MHRVELIYDEDCPNVPSARAAIARAFCEVGLTPRWTEWLRTAATSPPHVRSFGSPTVLVDGIDVADDAGQTPAGSCRLYVGRDGVQSGAPRADVIADALRRAGHAARDSMRTRNARSVLAGSLGPLVLLLPLGTCAACWPAYSAVLGSLGVGFLLSEPYLFRMALVLVAIAVASLLLDAWPRGRYGPALLGTVAAALGLVGRFALGNDAATIAGSVGLIAAALWSARAGRSHDRTTCGCGPRRPADRPVDVRSQSPAPRIR